MKSYDVFISYHWPEHIYAEKLAKNLREKHGLLPFLDRWYLVPGQNWPQAIEKTLSNCKSVVALIGPSGKGPWQQREINFALDRQAKISQFPVIPVILPNVEEPEMCFLMQNTWVDLRERSDNETLVTIIANAINGVPPSPETQNMLTEARSKICPYRGLLYFREGDAIFFFRDEQTIKKIAEAIISKAFVALVGSSGCGKSSIVRAGVVPYLRKSEQCVWDIITINLRNRPFYAIAEKIIPILEPEMTETDMLVEKNKFEKKMAAGEFSLLETVRRVLEKQPGTNRLLMVVDQWEDIYADTIDAATRRKFIEQILESIKESDGKFSVVITLRTDFLSKIQADRQLWDRLKGAIEYLDPMTKQELKTSITKPAEIIHIQLEDGLAERILDAVGDEPGNLPLMEFVLRQLWENRQGNLLMHSAYTKMNGLHGALEAKAEEVFNNLKENEQKEMRRLFLQLVQPGENREDTRRRGRILMINDTTNPIINKLSKERLIVVTVGSNNNHFIEVAHEALIRHWGLLKQWLDDNRDFLVWRDTLGMKISEWKRANLNKDGLLKGIFLKEATDYREKYKHLMTDVEFEYISKSKSRSFYSKILWRLIVTVVSIGIIINYFQDIMGPINNPKEVHGSINNPKEVHDSINNIK